MTEAARQKDFIHPELLPAQRAAGQARLEAFVRGGARRYGARRNYDFGPANRDNVSMLSPYIRHRLLLEEEVLSAVLAIHDLKECEKFVQEVFWRAYFKGWLEHRPAVWFAYRQQLASRIESLAEDESLRTRYESACAGRTGIESFDSWVGELAETGYLHNHARMWFASIWIFTLKLPWELGADFFLRYLLDGDAASNTLGWRWVAGLHTRGKTYLARASNIRKYTDGRFDPAPGELADEAPAIAEADLPPPVEIADGGSVPADTRFGLLVTDEDCNAETLDVPQAPSAVIGLSGADARSPLPVAEHARQFADDAVQDALERLLVAYDVPGNLHEESDWGSTLVQWARENDLKLIATAAHAQGGVNDRLAFAERDLDSAGIRLVRLRRDYDRRAWPFTTKGFFRLKKEIPSLLKAMDLGQRW